MSSTLSKFRLLARMIYPQYLEFEEDIKRGATKTNFIFETSMIEVYISNARFEVYINRKYHNTYSPSGVLEMRAIYVFWQVERYLKRNESLFAPARREPGVVEPR